MVRIPSHPGRALYVGFVGEGVICVEGVGDVFKRSESLIEWRAGRHALRTSVFPGGTVKEDVLELFWELSTQMTRRVVSWPCLVKMPLSPPGGILTFLKKSPPRPS